MTLEKEPPAGKGNEGWSLGSMMRSVLSRDVFRVLGGKNVEKTVQTIVDPNAAEDQLIQGDDAQRVIQQMIPQQLRGVLDAETLENMLTQLRDADLTDPNAARDQAQKLAGNEVIQRTLATTRKGQTIRNERPRIGQNDPCPCCSGKKFKKCHKSDPEGLAKILAEREKPEE